VSTLRRASTSCSYTDTVETGSMTLARQMDVDTRTGFTPFVPSLPNLGSRKSIADCCLRHSSSLLHRPCVWARTTLSRRLCRRALALEAQITQCSPLEWVPRLA
jgi:hypothetical protein